VEPLTRLALPPAVSGSRRLAAIVFTDLVDSTRLAQANERQALELIQQQEDLARPLIDRFRGRLVKSTGDGLLVEFPSALDAVEMSVNLQRAAEQRNSSSAGPPLRLRIGVHLGDVNRRGRDILGDAVNIAARIQALAEPGGVALSESVFDQVRNKVPYRLDSLGPQTLKGVTEPMVVYRVTTALASAPASPKPGSATRLAVLPLANISPDPKDEYFADGLTEELISALSRIQGIRVIARTSVLGYKASPKSVAQIGSELGVGSVLEGSVRKAGDRVRISLQLIDVASQEHAWAETYDRQLADIFAIQSEVAESTAKAIRVELSAGARDYIRRPPTSNLRAYELYLRSGLREGAPSTESYRHSRALLEEAIRIDPEFAAAHARLGNLFVQAAGDWEPHHSAFERARASISRALELDPQSSEGHGALANLVMQQDHDWERARSEFERAIALNPSNTGSRVTYATLLGVLGDVAGAEAQLKEAVATDPASVAARLALVQHALLKGDVPLALERRRELKAEDVDPVWEHVSFALAYAARGRTSDARAELTAAGRPKTPFERIAHALVLGQLGDPADARGVLQDIEGDPEFGFVSRDFVAALYAIVGEKERALELIGRTVEEGESGLWLRYNLPMFDSIRNDPRFVAALRALNLPATPPKFGAI
jgi:adenylate cyclase